MHLLSKRLRASAWQHFSERICLPLKGGSAQTLQWWTVRHRWHEGLIAPEAGARHRGCVRTWTRAQHGHASQTFYVKKEHFTQFFTIKMGLSITVARRTNELLPIRATVRTVLPKTNFKYSASLKHRRLTRTKKTSAPVRHGNTTNDISTATWFKHVFVRSSLTCQGFHLYTRRSLYLYAMLGFLTRLCLGSPTGAEGFLLAGVLLRHWVIIEPPLPRRMANRANYNCGSCRRFIVGRERDDSQNVGHIFFAQRAAQ